MAKDLMIRSSSAEFLIFERQTHDKGIQVRFEDGDLWLTQKSIGELFDTTRNNITMHINEIYSTYELDEKSTSKKLLLVQKEGNREVKRNIQYYNLDMVISIGYRVNSDKAIQFRRWATNILKEFSQKGYIIDKKRMANGAFFDEDYYDSLLAEIREIRISERRFYQKITDIYATSVDYDTKSPTTIKFFKKVQNKIHYAVSHQTAAEIIYNRADAKKRKYGAYKLAKLYQMTRNEKIIKLLYFKGKFDNKHIMLNKLKSKENDDNFTIIVSIIKNGRQNNG